MSEKIELEQLGGRSQRGPQPLRREPETCGASATFRSTSTVEMGRTRMTVGETLELRHGSIVTLNRMAGEPVDLLVNGTRSRAARSS